MFPSIGIAVNQRERQTGSEDWGQVDDNSDLWTGAASLNNAQLYDLNASNTDQNDRGSRPTLQRYQRYNNSYN